MNVRELETRFAVVKRESPVAVSERGQTPTLSGHQWEQSRAQADGWATVVA